MVLTFIVVFASTLLPGWVRIFPPWVVVLITGPVLRIPSGEMPVLCAGCAFCAGFVAAAIKTPVNHREDEHVRGPHGDAGIEQLNSRQAARRRHHFDEDIFGSMIIPTPATKTKTVMTTLSIRSHRCFAGLSHSPAIGRIITIEWRPTYVDYLFLAFCTATAFSPTEAMPMTTRAKLKLMAESLISLVTVMAIVSRAIGLLGS